MTQPAAARKRPSIRGGSAAAGALSRMTLAKLLGIAVPGAKWRIESALWTESGVRVAVRFGKRKPILFSIEPRQDDSRGVVMTDHLAVSYQGKDLPAALARRVASMGAKNLAGHDMDSLAEIFTSDPEFGKGEAPVPDTGAMSNRPDSLLDSWGDSTAWADFFAVDELARGNLDSLDNLFVFVQHGDIECEHLFPHGPAPVLSLVSYPWDHRVRTERSPPPRNEGGGMMLTSELNEDDVIRGNPEKLRRLIEAGVREAEKRGSTLFVSNTCVPVVTGEDVESEFRRCTAGCSKDALYLTIGPSSMVNVFQDLLVERRLRAEQRVETQGPHIVNLLGFPETRDLEELRTLLCDAGIEVNVVLVPGVSEEIVDSLPRAALNVIRPTSAWEHLYEHVTKDSRIPSLRPVAPYGMERSREWLFEIAKALDVGAEEAWDRCYAPLAGRWERLCEEASRYRVGLVVRANEIHNVL
ncbi:MAG: nitrogenase component 1, partial [Myxococcota bacterium]